jgi:hypothetical protein
MITALTAILAAQTIPSSASVIYPCFPESRVDTPVQMVTHGATYKIDNAKVGFESLTTLRNSSDKETTLEVVLPVRGKQVLWPQSEGVRMSALINKKPVSLKVGQIVRTEPTPEHKANGVWAASYERLYSVSLVFKPKETKSLSVSFASPIGRAGLDGIQRMVVYDTAGGDNWNGPVGQFNFAIQYERNTVLQVYAALPEGRWQIGEKGAFWKRNDFEPAQKAHLIFTYYPYSFEKIGGGG